MVKSIGLYVTLFFLILFFTGCKKDYKNDGGKSDAHVNMTTFEFLQSRPQFSSLVRLIERAGMIDAVNGNTTFFATTNYGVDEYMRVMKDVRVAELHDENIEYNLDSIPLSRLDSLKTYIFEGRLNREQLNVKGEYYLSQFGAIPNVRFRLHLDRVYQYTNYVDYVDYVVFSKVIGTLDADEPDPKAIPDEEVDKVVRCQTSGIITTNGIVHVLDGYHRLFFNTSEIK